MFQITVQIYLSDMTVEVCKEIFNIVVLEVLPCTSIGMSYIFGILNFWDY